MTAAMEWSGRKSGLFDGGSRALPPIPTGAIHVHQARILRVIVFELNEVHKRRATAPVWQKPRVL